MDTNRGTKNIVILIAVLILLVSAYYLYVSYMDYAAHVPTLSGHFSPFVNLLVFSAMVLLSLLLLVLIPRALERTNSDISETNGARSSFLQEFPDEKSAPKDGIFDPHGLPKEGEATDGQKGYTNGVEKGEETILIAKRSSLSSSIIEHLLSTVKDQKTVVVSNQLDFDDALEGNLKAVFADEEFLLSADRTTLIQNHIPIVLTSEPSSVLKDEGLNLIRIDTPLTRTLIGSIL